MVNLRRVFTFLLVIVGVLALSACKKDDPVIEVTEYSALGEWVDGGDGVYSLTTNTAEELDFSYAKGTHTDAYMVKDVSDVDLSTFKTLIVTVEGTGTMLLKLKQANGTAKEISLNVTGITGSYEWNLINDSDFLADVEKISIYAAPTKEDSTGDITISKLMFTVDVAGNYIIQTGFNNIPENVNEFDGTTDTFDFNAKWVNFAEDIYQVTYDGGKTEVSFDKAAGYEWSAMLSAVQGDFTDFNYIVLKVSGTDGQKLLVKPNSYNDYENFVFLTEDIQELVLDITDMSVADKNAITELYVFGAAGTASSGSFTIHEAFFAEEYEYVAPVYDHNVYESGDSFGLEYWYDGGDMNYTISTSGTDTTFDYSKTGEWTYAIAHIDGDLSDFNYIELVVTGAENKTALFKLEGTSGAIEEAVVFDGTQQTIMIDLSTMTQEQLSVINKLLIFAAQGSNIGSGTFTVNSITFMKSGLSVNDLWAENDVDTYELTLTDGVASINYTKGAGQEWVFLKTDFSTIDVTGYNRLTMTFDGEAGKSILVKPNDDGALEQTITFGDDPVTVTFAADSFSNIIIFAEAGVASVSGTFEITSTILRTVVSESPDLTAMVDFTTGAFVEGDAGTYTYTTVEGSTVVAYTKGAGQEWVFGKIDFVAQDVAGLNTMTLVLDGTSGKQILLKPNDDGALEQTVTFGDNPVTVVVTADQFANLVFFAEAGTASVSDSFTIVSATLSYEFTSTNWEDSGDVVYTILVTDGVTAVDYNKGVGQEWSFMRLNYEAADIEGLNTLTLVLDGTSGDQVLIKPNDNGAFEQLVTFGDDPVTVTITMDSLSFVVLFAQGGTASVSGSFEVLSTTVSYVGSDVDHTNSLDFTTGTFVEGDAGTYTFTTVTDTTVVNYTKGAGQEWVYGKIDFDADAVEGMNTMTLVLDGTSGKQVLLKPNDDGALEHWVTFGDDPITVVVNADLFTNLVFFAEAGDASVSGSFTIVSATLSYTYTSTEWIDNGDSVYTITVVDGVSTVDYTKGAGQEWTVLRINLDLEDVADLNTLTITLDGVSGDQVLVKPNDDGALENWVTFGDDPVTVVIPVESFTTIILFGEPGTTDVSGTFTVLETVLSYTETE